MDTRVSFEVGQSSGQFSQEEINNGMEPEDYKAAANGDIGHFGGRQNINLLLTRNENTVLHICLTSLKESESSTKFVEGILTKCEELLWKANKKGETPLHVAARYGHAAIVDILIKRARPTQPQEDLENGVTPQPQEDLKKMLEMKNKEEDTALHEAVRGNHLQVVKQLTPNDIDISYSQNHAGETPLYMAVEREFKEVAIHILKTCKSPAHEGPLGRTTLHAALIVNDKEMIEEILKSKPSPQEKSAFIKKVDDQRWTPLHCAAYFGIGYNVKMLLEVDRSIAYMKDAKGMTALHIAADRGHYWVMDHILNYCPDCCEEVDDQRGWNALHFIVNSSSSNWANNGAKHVLKKPSLKNLLNEKDTSGNTPLHLHSKSLHYIKDVMCHDGVDKMAFNKEHLNAYDVALTSKELSNEKFMLITRELNYKRCRAEFRRPLDDILPKRKDYEKRIFGDRGMPPHYEQLAALLAESNARKAEWKDRKDRFVSIMEKASKTHLVVDTLIATVAFTAGITMPGGFIGQEGPHSGSPVLMRNNAFKAFIITNTIAMVQSCSAAFIHLFMPLLFYEQNLGDFSFLLASLAFCLSISAMGAMVLAFAMGTLAVLKPYKVLAITNSVMGGCFFVPVFFVSIGCSEYLLEILRVGSSWIFHCLWLLSDYLPFVRRCIFNLRRR